MSTSTMIPADTTADAAAVVDTDAGGQPAEVAAAVIPGQRAGDAPVMALADLVTEPHAAPGQIATWLGRIDGLAAANEPLSVTITGATREAYVHLPDTATFDAWRERLHVEEVIAGTDKLVGAWRTCVAYHAGWTLHIQLVGHVAGVDL